MAEIKICDNPSCARPGKLVQQFVAKPFGIDPFVFRRYLCQWHLAGWNRTRLEGQRKLSVTEHKPDDEILNQES